MSVSESVLRALGVSHRGQGIYTEN